MRTSTPLVLLAAALVALAGCGGPALRAQEEQGRMLLVQGRDDGGMDAGIEGEVGLSDQYCFGLLRDDGSVDLVIWPPGFEITSGGDIRATDGTVIREGDVISGGGGEVDARASYGDDAGIDDCLPEGSGTTVTVVDVVSSVSAGPLEADPG